MPRMYSHPSGKHLPVKESCTGHDVLPIKKEEGSALIAPVIWPCQYLFKPLTLTRGQQHFFKKMRAASDQ